MVHLRGRTARVHGEIVVARRHDYRADVVIAGAGRRRANGRLVPVASFVNGSENVQYPDPSVVVEPIARSMLMRIVSRDRE